MTDRKDDFKPFDRLPIDNARRIMKVADDLRKDPPINEGSLASSEDSNLMPTIPRQDQVSDLPTEGVEPKDGHSDAPAEPNKMGAPSAVKIRPMSSTPIIPPSGTTQIDKLALTGKRELDSMSDGFPAPGKGNKSSDGQHSTQIRETKTQLYTDLENSFMSFLREDPTRTTPAPATMAAQHFEARIEALYKTQLKAILKSWPKTESTNIDDYAESHMYANARGFNQAIDQTRAIIEKKIEELG